MRITAIKDIDECIGKSWMKEVVFESPITGEQIIALGSFGKLEFHDSFQRPLFRLDMSDGTIVKGVQGSCSLWLIPNRRNIAESVRRFQELVEQVPADSVDTATELN